MFRVSRRVDYGLRLLMALAEDPNTTPQPTSQLAEKLGIPLAFLHQIGRSLIQGGLLKASPGPGGGLRLNRSPDSITLRQVMEILEGPIRLNASGEAAEDVDCTPTCGTQVVWQEIQDRLIDHLSAIRLDGLTQSPEKILSFPNFDAQNTSYMS